MNHLIGFVITGTFGFGFPLVVGRIVFGNWSHARAFSLCLMVVAVIVATAGCILTAGIRLMLYGHL